MAVRKDGRLEFRRFPRLAMVEPQTGDDFSGHRTSLTSLETYLDINVHDAIDKDPLQNQVIRSRQLLPLPPSAEAARAMSRLTQRNRRRCTDA